MTEAEFLQGYDPSAYERLSVAVDLVLLGVRAGRPAVLLMQRAEHPHAGRFALPGGFVGLDESLDAAAARVLREKAGLDGTHLEQLYTFGAVDRDPRTRIVTVAYLALMTEAAFDAALRGMPTLTPAAIDVPWVGEAGGPVRVKDGDNRMLSLAFDHGDILALAIRRLRGKLDYSDVGFAFLPAHFTLRQLQDVHEAILGITLNKPAFRRRMIDKGWLAATGRRETETSYRPAELYRFQRQI
jgi:8-oxo-dGTP diphosphatase